MDIERMKKKAVTKTALNDYMMLCCDFLNIICPKLHVAFNADAPYKCEINYRDLERVTIRSSDFEVRLNLPDKYDWFSAIESVFWACRKIYQEKCFADYKERNSTFPNPCAEKYENINRDTYEHIEDLWKFEKSLEEKPYYFSDWLCLDADVFADYMRFYLTTPHG